jgi:ribose transport system ATP-binding protein
MEEVLELSDRLVILKDGRLVGTRAPDIDTATLHRLMVGRERAADFYATALQRTDFGDPVLRLEGLSGEAFAKVDLTVYAREIVGIGGLVQSGKTELGLSIFGAHASQGTVAICGRPAQALPIADRIKLGAGYVPLNRHFDGILLGRSIRDNIGLPDLASGSVFGLVDDARTDAAAESALSDMAIKAPNIAALARHLSGGNQQKVVLAKWLKRNPRLLVLDNPTRGVDAGAKEEIYRLIRATAASGCGVLLITDDLVELIELSNRIYFMRGGALSEPVEAPADAKPAEHDVIHLMV